MVTQSRNSYMEAELMVLPLDELCKAHEEEVDVGVEEEDEEGSYHAHLERLFQNLLEEAKDKSKGWVSRPTTSDHTELASKKVGGRASRPRLSELLYVCGNVLKFDEKISGPLLRNRVFVF